jgi:hypothetical protein
VSAAPVATFGEIVAGSRLDALVSASFARLPARVLISETSVERMPVVAARLPAFATPFFGYG